MQRNGGGGGYDAQPLLQRGSGDSGSERFREAPPPPPAKSDGKPGLGSGHLYWSVVIAMSCLLALATHLAMGGGSSALGIRSPQPQLSVLEQQLMGCRTTRDDPIPSVDTRASLAVLNTYSPQQLQTAEEFTAAVGACQDFACLRRANELPRAPGQFRFPHFFVIGFQKCATTSVYCHLITHPQVQYPLLKEPHTLKDKCSRPGMQCSPEVQREYVVDILNLREAAQSKFTKASFEGSTHYAAEAEWLARPLAAHFPWLKVVVSMREPISQAIAMHLHNLSHGRPGNCTADPADTSIFHCIRKALKFRSRYADKLRLWLEAFPAEQLHLVQFEALAGEETMEGAMQGLKEFLEVDPRLTPNSLPLTNFKHQRGNEDTLGHSWPLARTEYEFLVEQARNDTREVMEVLQRGGFASQQGAQQWGRRWERVWEDNLARCEGQQCRIVVSG